jgi:hypothetical protein
VITADTITDEQIRELDSALIRVPEHLPDLDWMTASARDAVRIAVYFAGFDAKELIGRIARIKSTAVRQNAATVYRVMGEMAEEYTERQVLIQTAISGTEQGRKHARARCAEILNARAKEQCSSPHGAEGHVFKLDPNTSQTRCVDCGAKGPR